MHDRNRLVLPTSRVPIIWPVEFYEDCEGTFFWVAAGDGADFDAELSTDTALVGTHSLLLRTKLTSPTLGDGVSVTKRLWLTPLKVLSLEFCFAPTTGGIKQMTASLLWYDGVDKIQAILRFGVTGPVVEYLTSVGGFTQIAGATWKAGTYYWNRVRMLIDLDALTWLPGVVNNKIIQSDTPALPSDTDPTTPYLELTFGVIAGAAARAGFWFDQIVLKSLNP